jgi:integrase
MSRPRKSLPRYLEHKRSGKGRLVWTDTLGIRHERLLPGLYQSPDSLTAKARLELELAISPTQPAANRTAITVNEVLLSFLTWAATHYRTPTGEPTTEIAELKWSIRPVRELYGDTPAELFGPRSLAAVRQHMIGLQWCRTLINRRIDRVKRVFKWATSEELVPVTVYQALRTLTGLQKGRTTARESEPVKPVDPAHVAATLPRLNRHVRAMVQLQQHTGMRPSEVCGLSIGQIDRTSELWVYRPVRHKTAHRGKSRAIPLGPRARSVLIAFLVGDKPPPIGFEAIDLAEETMRLVAANAYHEAGRERDAVLLISDRTRLVVSIAGCIVDPTATVFSPAREREERHRVARQNRKSKVPPSQQNRRKVNPQRVPSEAYHPRAYTAAIAVAAKKAGIPHWHPNQLRHAHATRVRKEFGLEAAGAALGHSKMSATEVYAERDTQLAITVAMKLG